jgi:hypothetical protein
MQHASGEAQTRPEARRTQGAGSPILPFDSPPLLRLAAASAESLSTAVPLSGARWRVRKFFR